MELSFFLLFTDKRTYAAPVRKFFFLYYGCAMHYAAYVFTYFTLLSKIHVRWLEFLIDAIATGVNRTSKNQGRGQIKRSDLWTVCYQSLLCFGHAILYWLPITGLTRRAMQRPTNQFFFSQVSTCCLSPATVIKFSLHFSSIYVQLDVSGYFHIKVWPIFTGLHCLSCDLIFCFN